MTRQEIEQLADERYPTAKDYDSSLTTIAERKGWIAGFTEGLTINPWHSVEDGDLPKKSGDYLCSDGEEFVVACYSDASRCFVNPLVRYGGEYNDWIKYWAEIPQFAKQIIQLLNSGASPKK